MVEPKRIRVDLKTRAYDIVIGDGLLAQTGTILLPEFRSARIFVVSDKTVWSLHGQRLQNHLHATLGRESLVRTLPPGEQAKTFDQLGGLLNWLLDHKADRHDVLFAFGGGSIGDLAGLAACLLKRGMGLVQIPTTLLAQVDSSVGGKTAINTRHGKNLIGTFYQPGQVIIDTSLLSSLPKREYRSGYAEIVKYGLVNDPSLVAWLEREGTKVTDREPAALTHAIAVSCQAKAAIVVQDEYDKGARALLNFGHTFGHALEAVNEYRSGLQHGEAVASGMILALKYSARLGLINEQAIACARNILAAAGLQTSLSRLDGGPWQAKTLIRAMQQDKKARSGKIPLILARGIGQAFVYRDTDLSDVQTFLQKELTNNS